jgi:hypothetical protein
MTEVTSPEAGPRRPYAYELETEHVNRKALAVALGVQNRLCMKSCSALHHSHLEGYAGGGSSLVYTCEKCSFLLCAKICQSSNPDRNGRITIVREHSNLVHESLCTSHPAPPTRKELKANPDFVMAVKYLKTHREINAVVERMFQSSIKALVTSALKKDLAKMTQLAGFAEGFSWVRDLMEKFAARNPGTYYEVNVNDQGEFESLVFIPAQSYNIVKFAARPYYMIDMSHSIRNSWKTKLAIFEVTDGNNEIMPIGMGLYGGESIDSFVNFVDAVKSICNGELGLLLNQPTSVVCTDRAKAMRPSMERCLPLVQHRHDTWHILKNINDTPGLQSDMASLLACQKATTLDLFNTAMDAYREKYPAAAHYVNEIPHNQWTTYKAVTSTNPFRLFGLTDSQSVEQEMGRLKCEAVAVRHQLPFMAVSNFINHFARLVDDRRTSCTAMLARDTLFLTVHADMYTGDQIQASKVYGVRTENAVTGEYEVWNKEQPLKRRMVNFRAQGCKIIWCSCEGPRLMGLICRHVIAVWRYLTSNKLITATVFMEVFGDMIPHYYKKGEYTRGYADVVLRPILDSIRADSTLPPLVDLRPGPPQLKRIPGRSEGGFTGDSARKKAKTGKNMALFSVATNLTALAAVPHTGTRSAATGIVVGMRQLMDTAVSRMAW